MMLRVDQKPCRVGLLRAGGQKIQKLRIGLSSEAGAEIMAVTGAQVSHNRVSYEQ